MARYCFLERQQEVFIEACVRGWLAAVLDFPHAKASEEACNQAAQSIPDAMRAEVCCIPENDYPYRHLIVSGWVATYVAVGRDLTEREIVYQKGALARASTLESRAVLRRGMAESKAITEVWSQYQAEVTL